MVPSARAREQSPKATVSSEGPLVPRATGAKRR